MISIFFKVTIFKTLLHDESDWIMLFSFILRKWKKKFFFHFVELGYTKADGVYSFLINFFPFCVIKMDLFNLNNTI